MDYKREKLQKKLKLWINGGVLTIPREVEVIKEGAYEGEALLVRVRVPGTVKKIESRAFADCENLEEVILEEGLLSMESGVFTGCKALRSVRIPDSVKDVRGWDFCHSEVKEPVLSASGDRLIYCPKEAAGSVYRVPDGVKEIGVQAFMDLEDLKKVELPEGLQVIRSHAFFSCGITEVDIPGSVETIETGAFYFCRKLAHIQWDNGDDLVRARLDLFRVRDWRFLVAYDMELPKKKHWSSLNFRMLARQCGLGKMEAMEEMAEYFHKMAEEDPETIFYLCASQFWIYQAYRQGSEKAREYLEHWFRENGENTRMASPFLSEKLRGSADGEALRALGFFFFKEGTYYSLEGKDQDGVVEVSTWVSDDGADDDGFGREEYYDFWYLDDCLNLPCGGKRLHEYSSLDRRTEPVKALFDEQHEIAARAVRERGHQR